jgi:K+-transporting ATPase ATPase C chain
MMRRQLLIAIRSTFVLLVAFGLVFPLVITTVARLAFPHQSRGSLIRVRGRAIGSDLIGQSFTAPGYFHPRPSAAGSGYDAANSGSTNLGPTSAKLVRGIHRKLPNGKDDPSNFAGIADLAAAYRRGNGLAPNAPVPPDAVTRSASGLDPDISPTNAYLQVPRVAKARHLREDRVKELVRAQVTGRQLGFLGEPRVNVLHLNRALNALTAAAPR